MKASFLYVLSLSILIYTASLFQPLIALASTLILSKRRIALIEVVVLVISYFVLSYVDKTTFLPFTMRAVTLVNLYLISSQLVDVKSLVKLTKGKAIPIIVAMMYYPFFYDTVMDIVNYARARRIKIYRIDKLLLPVIVFIVKTAEDLYLNMVLKLNGNYKGNIEIMPRRDDIAVLVYGVAVLCLSLSLRF